MIENSRLAFAFLHVLRCCVLSLLCVVVVVVVVVLLLCCLLVVCTHGCCLLLLAQSLLDARDRFRRNGLDGHMHQVGGQKQQSSISVVMMPC